MMWTYEESSFVLDPGDILAFYSDGISDTQNFDKEFYGTDRLCDFIRTHAVDHGRIHRRSRARAGRAFLGHRRTPLTTGLLSCSRCSDAARRTHATGAASCAPIDPTRLHSAISNGEARSFSRRKLRFPRSPRSWNSGLRLQPGRIESAYRRKRALFAACPLRSAIR